MKQTELLEFDIYLKNRMDALPVLRGTDLFAEPERVALISVDLIKGFCDVGPLSSPRVRAVVAPATDLFSLAHQHGVTALALAQDTHEPDAKEFSAWPPHCVRGTVESETVDELKALPFFDQISIFEKNSINSAEFTGLEAWIAARPALDTFLVVGDCTDLCVYQLAMHLLTQANARQMQRRVIVPANCVDTYDLPTETAIQAGLTPHPADLMHALFLYHMALNGVEIVQSVQ
ncbi:MAG TPA: nicotinamidase [Anaerolineaceae bacterium]|jgi:nicotinamidase-related amidase|nr:nicotinamidase [Anaerolineaceae bacterium]